MTGQVILKMVSFGHMKHQKTCKQCGKRFKQTQTESMAYWETKKFCSPECYSDSKKGVPQWQKRSDGNPLRHSDTQIRCECGCGELIKKYDDRGRIKKFKQGHQNERFTGVNRPKISRKLKRLIRDGKWHPPVMKGSDHPAWKGGSIHSRDQRRVRVWKLKVHRLDNWKCRICGKRPRGKDLIAHHIRDWNAYPKLRFITANGMTLCRKCHIKLHKPSTQ